MSSLPTNWTDASVSTNSNALNWPVLGLSGLAVFGALGNLLVCASISLDRRLQTVTNWFLFSLAIADCLVSLIVLPLSIVKEFQGTSTRRAPISAKRFRCTPTSAFSQIGVCDKQR